LNYLRLRPRERLLQHGDFVAEGAQYAGDRSRGWLRCADLEAASGQQRKRKYGRETEAGMCNIVRIRALEFHL